MNPKTRNILALVGIMLAIYAIAWLTGKNGNPNMSFITVDRIWVIELPLAIVLIWELWKKEKK